MLYKIKLGNEFKLITIYFFIIKTFIFYFENLKYCNNFYFSTI